MKDQDSQSFHYVPGFNPFADQSSQDNRCSAFQLLEINSMKYCLNDRLPIFDNPSQQEISDEEQVLFPIHPTLQENNPQEPLIQSKKQNFPKIFIRLLKKFLKVMVLTQSIEKIYLIYVQKLLKWSIKSLQQVIMPFPICSSKKIQQLKNKFITQFESSHPNLYDFAQTDHERKIQIVNRCRQSIRNKICLLKNQMIQMANKNNIKNPEKKKQFPQYVERFLLNLQKSKMRGKDIKLFKRD